MILITFTKTPTNMKCIQVVKFLIRIIITKMEMEKRRSVRLLSSLRDLKIEDFAKVVREQEGKTRANKKLMAIKSPTEDDSIIHQNFTKVDHKATDQDYNIIRQCLASHFVFSSLIKDNGIITYLLDNFFCCEVKANEYIMKQGDDASSFFVLQKGRIAVFINGEMKREIKPQEGFGELALLYNAPRSASLKAQVDCTLWGIDRGTFKKVISQACQKQFTDNRKFIEDVKFFEYLTSQQKDALATQLILHKYDKGVKIVNQGDPADSFYIIKSGKVRTLQSGKEVSKLKAGDCFGENALLSDEGLRRNTVESQTECYVLALGRDSFKHLLGRHLHVIVVRNKIGAVLANSALFSQLPKMLLERVIDCLLVEKLTDKTTIVKSGDFCRDKLFFVLEGTLVKDGNQSVEYRNVFFGEKAITNENSKQKYPFSLKFQSDGVIAWANYQTITQALGGTYQETLNRQKNAKTQAKAQKDNVNTFKQTVDKLALDGLYVLKNLGHGQFGTVYLVTNEARTDFYALKCIEKSMIVEGKLEKHLQNQKIVLEQINHPFLIHCGRSFKDQNYIYFLTEHINGMELFDVIRDIGLLTSKDASYYVAMMLSALQYLNKSNIIYRDLKPQNVMVDKDGYIKLIDMGTCKIMSSKAVLPKTFTIIGTPHYMAPEVLSGKGYTYYADLWSLGVCMFEFMVGYVPFGEDAEDPYEIYEEIIKKELSFPKYIADEKAKSLMKQLLSKIAEPRLGGSFSTIQNHPWFSNIEWDLLLSKKLKMPYLVPENKLVNTKQLVTGSKRLNRIQDQLAGLAHHVPKKNARKDLAADWDKMF